jgi:uncharacterized protein YdaU (DUF1376 family)
MGKKKKETRLAWCAHYVDQFLAGTAHMTLQEIGQYRLALDYQWKSGDLKAIPDDPDWLRRRLRDTELSPVVREKFDAVDVSGKPYLRNRRCADEWSEAKRVHSKAVRNGGKGGRPKGRKPQPSKEIDGKPNGNLQDNLEVSGGLSSSEARASTITTTNTITTTGIPEGETTQHIAGAKPGGGVQLPDENVSKATPWDDHFAVRAFESVFGHLPHIDGRERIAGTVVDASVWQETLEYWHGNGYSDGKVWNIVDRYKNTLKRRQVVERSNGAKAAVDSGDSGDRASKRELIVRRYVKELSTAHLGDSDYEEMNFNADLQNKCARHGIGWGDIEVVLARLKEERA